MPFIADNLVVFLWWLSVRVIRELRSLAWPSIEAAVSSIEIRHWVNPIVQVKYHFKLHGQSYRGTTHFGFWYKRSAEDFAYCFQVTKNIRVRYSPHAPNRSALVMRDQTVAEAKESQV